MASASSHGFEDLDAVAGRERLRVEARARHHVPVHRHRDAPPLEPQGLHQLLDGAAGRDLAGLAVDEESQGGFGHGCFTRGWSPVKLPERIGGCQPPLRFCSDLR
jgi:hypothetical protein